MSWLTGRGVANVWGVTMLRDFPRLAGIAASTTSRPLVPAPTIPYGSSVHHLFACAASCWTLLPDGVFPAEQVPGHAGAFEASLLPAARGDLLTPDAFPGGEHVAVELQGLDGVLNDQARGDPAVAVGDRLCW